MAKPRESYPESATNRETKAATNGEGEAALEAALAKHGEDLADVVERTDEAEDALTTAVLVAASADDDEVDHIVDRTANLVEAVDGLATEDAAALATAVGEDADDLAELLDAVGDLQRAGHLDDLLTVAAAFSESLSPSEVEELAALLERDGAEVVGALDTVLELQRSGSLEPLLDTAETLSAVELDDDAVAGLNTVLGAVGTAERQSEHLGPLGAARRLWSRDGRAGLGYVVTVLTTLGRRLRER